MKKIWILILWFVFNGCSDTDTWKSQYYIYDVYGQVMCDVGYKYDKFSKINSKKYYIGMREDNGIYKPCNYHDDSINKYFYINQSNGCQYQIMLKPDHIAFFKTFVSNVKVRSDKYTWVKIK